MQNFRGAHESEGVFQGYRSLGLGELKDGYDTVEWFAKQPWCTGKVGSWGGSQGGYSQNFLAASRPPHLVCQYMTDFGVSLFHDGYRAGGVVRPRRFLGRMAIHAREPAQGRQALIEQLKHPVYDDWWKVEDTSLHFGEMEYPAVMLGGWFDPVHNAVVRCFDARSAAFPGKNFLILGPWTHGGSLRGSPKVGDLEFAKSAVFDVRGHEARWFEHYLRGADNGVTSEPVVRYYAMGACGEAGAPGNEWRTDREFPPKGASEVAMYFGAAGSLSESPSDGAGTYTSDPYRPNKVSGDRYPGAEDQRKYEAHGDVVTFTTDVLKKPVEWTGLVRAKLWVSSTARDTDFIVRVTDVYPDGRSILLMDNIRRARFRDGFEREELMEPGKVYPVAFDVGYTSIVFNAGHRIRVTVGSSGDDWYEVNPQTGGPFGMELPRQMVVAKNTIWRDREHPSQILAPVRE
jgi:putative CocE/NonD family hydrolase